MAGLYLKIDGTEYAKTNVYSLKRSADVLDKYAQRTEDGELHREVIGTYYNYDLELGCDDTSEYNRLFDALAEPTASHTIYIPCDDGGNTSQTFEAYISSVKDEVNIIDYDGTTHWKNLTCKFTAMKPTRKA
jgi:hypothetical protein